MEMSAQNSVARWAGLRVWKRNANRPHSPFKDNEDQALHAGLPLSGKISSHIHDNELCIRFCEDRRVGGPAVRNGAPVGRL